MICGGIFDIENLTQELSRLEAEAGAPDFWNDQTEARKIIDKTNAVRARVKPFLALEQGIEDVEVMLELAEEEPDGASRSSVLNDVSAQVADLEKQSESIEFQSLLSEPFDANGAYLSINAGAGGTESCDWADILYRMYTRYAEAHGFEITVLNYLPGDEAGIKSVSLLISGPYAYGYLKNERGVHRLVRISPFDSNSRRHTSFCAVDVVAEVDDSIEIEIVESDLRIDTYRSSGAGGQHVNTTDSAVRVTHLPTGIVVQCQAERSQHANRNKAMNMLKAQLYEYEKDQQKKEMEKFYGDKGEIAWGSQIRSYVMQPYTMVKDHRTNVDIGNINAVLDGDLDALIEANLKQTQKNNPQ